MNSDRLNILLSLISDDSDYQVANARAAQEVARKYGFGVEVVYAGGDAVNQSQQLLKVIQTKGLRPDVIIMEPAGTGLVHVAREAVKAGMGWIVMNRDVDYLAELKPLAKLPVFCMSTNHLEVGRVQGKQLNELLPDGGSVLYVQGPASSEAAQFRTKGMSETKRTNIQVRMMNGRWTEQSAYDSVSAWLRLSTSRDATVHVVAAQNDFMAMGARKAIAAITNDTNRAKWEPIKFLGVDGLAEHGYAWARSGLLAATIITPTIADLAIEMLAKAVKQGVQPPPRSFTEPCPFPPLGKLTPVRILPTS
jgi:ribose transport system substrate-binding protein